MAQSKPVELEPFTCSQNLQTLFTTLERRWQGEHYTRTNVSYIHTTKPRRQAVGVWGPILSQSQASSVCHIARRKTAVIVCSDATTTKVGDTSHLQLYGEEEAGHSHQSFVVSPSAHIPWGHIDTRQNHIGYYSRHETFWPQDLTSREPAASLLAKWHITLLGKKCLERGLIF